MQAPRSQTFEGHSNSVLRVDFLTRGMQLVSCASDGLVKVWNVKDENCATTLDNHEEKVRFRLSFHAKPRADPLIVADLGPLRCARREACRFGRRRLGDNVLGGCYADGGARADSGSRGAGSQVRCSFVASRLSPAHRFRPVSREQDFENYLSIKDYSNAILLALSMDQPRRLLKLFTEVRAAASDDSSSLTGSTNVDAVLKSLTPVDLRQLLFYVKDWNTVSRTAEIAQAVLYAVLKMHSAEAVLACLEPPVEAPTFEEDAGEDDDGDDGDTKLKAKKKKKREMKAGEILQALLPYTERHMTRADKMVRESFIVEHLLGQMDSFELMDDEGMDVDGASWVGK
jgi:U3 small nucleolar RNA-associated protein 13